MFRRPGRLESSAGAISVDPAVAAALLPVVPQLVVAALADQEGNLSAVPKSPLEFGGHRPASGTLA